MQISNKKPRHEFPGRKKFIKKIEIYKSCILGTLKSFILGKDQKPQGGDGYHYEYDKNTRSREDEWKDFIYLNKYPFLIGCFYCAYAIYLLILAASYVHAMLNLSPRALPGNKLTLLICGSMPFAAWAWSTTFVYWNYWRRKLLSLQLGIAGLLTIAAGQLYQGFYRPLMAGLSKIPINTSISEKMVINLGRVALTSVSLVPCVIAGYQLYALIHDPDYKADILYFKLNRGKDHRREKEFKYDFKIIYSMETGKAHTVKEKDRTLHMFADGTTGTAKTSSVLTPAIADDMDQKVFNEDYQKKICLAEINKGHFRIIKPFDDQDFSINYIEPVIQEGLHNQISNRQRKKKYEYLKYSVQSAGITAIAPNSAWADEIYEMAKNRHLKIHRVDPMLATDGKQKPGFIGFNPFLISPLLQGVERDVDITNKANIFADILQAYYEMSGSGDAYFISLNNSVTKATCKLLMLTYADLHHGQQADAGDVQRLINDFSLMRPYLGRLIEKYNSAPTASPYDKVGFAAKSQSVDCGIWQDIYTLINNDLLGPNADKMAEHANGLRLQINNFVNHPLIRRVFCAKESLDIDKALANGEIIVVNYALELGRSVSMMFGLFFLLSYSKACLRRPGNEHSRILNLNYIDEFPVLLHPDLEEFFTLFRQYKVANIVALQTLDQMDKSKVTEHLKGILLGNCAHQIVFGRVSPSEMEIYEKMAGKTVDMLRQDTVSQTSITHETPSYSYSSRVTRQISNRIEGSEFRYRDFQEVTFFTVDNGSPVYPFAGRVNFLPSARRKGKPRLVVDWQRFYPEELLGGGDGPPVHTALTYQHSSRIQTAGATSHGSLRFSAKGMVLEATGDGSPTFPFVMAPTTSLPNGQKNIEADQNEIQSVTADSNSDPLPETGSLQIFETVGKDGFISLDDLLAMADTIETGDSKQ